jgi:hypothetical protein
MIDKSAKTIHRSSESPARFHKSTPQKNYLKQKEKANELRYMNSHAYQDSFLGTYVPLSRYLKPLILKSDASLPRITARRTDTPARQRMGLQK